MINEELINEFIEDMRLQRRTEGTLREYRNRLIDIEKRLEKADFDLQKIDEKTNFVELYQKSDTTSGSCITISTIRNKMSTFHVYNDWAIKKGYMDCMIISPDDYPKNVNVNRIRRLSDDDLSIFYNFIDNLNPNARAAFYLMAGSGCRVGEAAHLRPEDVTLRGKSVYINITDAKWGSDRNIPIIDTKAAKIVWQYRADIEVDNRPLFRLSKRTLQGYATKFAKDTGITFRCHLLRHTFAALLSEKGVPMPTIQYLLGHKSLNMTAHYTQSALVDLSEITSKIEL